MTQSLQPKNLVLYADDDPDDIQLMTETFNAYTHSIELMTFRDGSDLLRYVERLNALQPAPCLIILDINMPLMSGKETLKRLRGIDHLTEVPIVLFSTSTLPSEAAFAQSFGAAFITKPLNYLQMSGVIDQFIDNCADETKKQIRQAKGKY